MTHYFSSAKRKKKMSTTNFISNDVIFQERMEIKTFSEIENHKKLLLVDLLLKIA